MKLESIKTTPNPNCVMLTFDAVVSSVAMTIDRGSPAESDAPEIARHLLAIDGVRSVFLSRDFITITRAKGADWEGIMEAVERQLGTGTPPASTAGEGPGRVEVTVQVFREIPVQVRAVGADGQGGVALPQRFGVALARALDQTGADYLRERRWRAHEHRYGDPAEIAQMVADEIASALDEERLDQLVQAVIADTGEPVAEHAPRSQDQLLADLEHEDWHRRLDAIQQVSVDEASLPAIVQALGDKRSAVRRWAASTLGASGMPEAVDPLCVAVVQDPSNGVRRTAGDALSDLADPRAIGAMCRALGDPSKQVRWRAARFLNEIGDRSAVESLRDASEGEDAFEVRMEMRAALERIESGAGTQKPMWMRLAGRE